MSIAELHGKRVSVYIFNLVIGIGIGIESQEPGIVEFLWDFYEMKYLIEILWRISWLLWVGFSYQVLGIADLGFRCSCSYVLGFLLHLRVFLASWSGFVSSFGYWGSWILMFMVLCFRFFSTFESFPGFLEWVFFVSSFGYWWSRISMF